MKQPDNIKKVQERESRLTYTGKYSDLQVYGNSYRGMRYSQYEQDPYNLNQNQLYKRVLYGLSVYNQKEIKSMHVAKRARIERVHKRTQKELNLWKQEKVIELTNKVFGLFHNSPMAKEIINNCSDSEGEVMNCFSFKDLYITKNDIVEKLIEVGILPKHFYALK